MEYILSHVHYGQSEVAHGRPDHAIPYFTRALDFFHGVGRHHNPTFWSDILLYRADCYLRLQQYGLAIRDIQQALNDCPNELYKGDHARLWFEKGRIAPPDVGVWCFSAALHFSAGDQMFQSEIYSERALAHYNGKNHEECERDIEKSKSLNRSLSVGVGRNLLNEGTQMIQRKKYDQAVRLLQLAENFLRPLNQADHSTERLWQESCKGVIYAAWCGKMYVKAIQSGKKRRLMEKITSEKEARVWKERGNEMIRGKKFTLAIDCYTLSIQYIPDNDDELRGTLYSNRSQAYLKKNLFKESKEDAEKCLKYRPDWCKSYYRLGSALSELKEYDRALDMFRKWLSLKDILENDKYEVVEKIMKIALHYGPMKVNFELPRDCVSRYLKECIERNDWKSLEVFLLGGGGKQSYGKGEGGIATGNCDLSEISLCGIVKSDPKPSSYYQLITVMIDHGVFVNGRNEQDIPLALAVNHNDHDLAVVLLEKNANPDGLTKSKFGKHDDMPIHSAFRIGLNSGHWKVFTHLMENSATATPCLEILDRKGNSLYHIVASGDRAWHHVNEGVEFLRKYGIDPRTRNKDGKTPLMMIRQNNDLRYRLIEESIKSLAPENTKKKKRKKKNRIKEETAEVSKKCDEAKDTKKVVTPIVVEIEPVVTTAHRPTEIEKLREKISQAIEDLPEDIKCENETKESKCNDLKETEEVDQDIACGSNETISNQELSDNTITNENQMIQGKAPIPALGLNLEDKDNEEIDDQDYLFDDTSEETFDKLTWEVECTSDVWKKLKDKKLPRDKKKKIVRIIRQLANGIMRGNLAKPLVGIAKESDIRLFEAKLDKSARILWERAIAFSPRCSALSDNKNENKGEIYTEVIRIWDIVFDHDTVPRKIKRIVRSYNRGTSCFIKKNLKGTPVDNSSSAIDDQKSVPKLYVLRDDPKQTAIEYVAPIEKSRSSNETSKMFFPPGSPEETEYHILKFYAFSNAMVNAMLDGQITSHFDFPFRVSELEHSVINLAPKQMTSILLLGRSGTGKTTCCLYRLWNNYQKYWQSNTISEPSIPNVAQFIPRQTDDDVDNAGNEGEKENETSTFEETSCSSLHRASHATQDDQGCSSSSLQQEAWLSMDETREQTEIIECTNHESSCQNDSNADSLTIEKKKTFEHLHQAFITKNAVLCKEVQKNFTELSHACFSTPDDVTHQQSAASLAYKFDQVEEQAWPLFICSRDWLLMLDASLPGEPFFQRNEDGKLERNVKGWAEEDNNLQEIPEEYSDDEDESDDEIESKPAAAAEGEHNEQQSEGKLDLRREITYQVFKNELWRKMTKRKKVDYHSSLVWTEIISFIKGSVEALHNELGYITLEEYQTIGNKRAPSFTADRETVYELFLAYQRIRRSLGMFDEADVVHHIYHRLEHHVPTWSIHEIYVDETQDFTQAELSVIIRSCRNPNRLFFTGDTAQSIMRGIAFRFSDLRSLFYYMKESVKAIGQEADVVVPDRVYELTHNYRSHAGILNLASSVTDLLSHFFPESFDRLARDQGLFDGPKPVLLESCSFSDLAVILRGHKRKTSPIEFGAHQVILVASDEVRNSLPEELSLALVMTIYEAKGLEFDDVLIYNFFKDSQALKEWRVVGTYKENLDDDTNVSATGIAEIMADNVEYKARPLEFNPDQHKILISEFKYLYTALTRARVNVWLFDESEEARTPMFEYFQKRGVVDVKHVQKTEDDTASLEGMFAQKSGKDEWRKQGIFFYGKGLWKVASKCFAMADEEMWMKKCNAHEHAAEAATMTSEPRKLRFEFMKAADLFLECDMKIEAEKCLFNARERILLAKLHEKSKNFSKAAKIFYKEGKFRDAARNFESGRNFEGAVDSLLKINQYNEVLNIISRYNDLVQRGEENSIVKHLRFDQRDESICYQAAKFYQRRGDHGLMEDALERLPKVKDRITFLQRNGFFEKAAKLLLKEGKAQEAAKLMRSKGRFLEAARYSDDDKFIAECYLLAARSTILSMKSEGQVLTRENEELVEGLLERAAEMYKRCNDLNGQAETKFARGRFYKNAQDVEEAGNLFYQATNYAALTDCFLLLMKTNPEKFFRPKARDTLKGLLHLICAFHKQNKGNNEHTVISMCYEYFGLKDTDETHSKKVPHLEMVRFATLYSAEMKFTQDEMIPVIEVDKLIKDRLYKMAQAFIEKVWDKQQQIVDKCTPCPRFIAEITCDVNTCKHHHGEVTRQYFADRFHALLFLVNLEEIVANFLKEMKRESAKVKNQLQKTLFIHPEFTACDRLYELLFPREGNFVASYFLSERDVHFLRRKVSGRIMEFAREIWYVRCTEEERWTSSDLSIEVSNLMRLAGGSVDGMLSAEERKFEERKFKDRKLKDHPGMFVGRYAGRYDIFSRSLERSKYLLYYRGDILNSLQAAVKQFLFSPAKRKALPYPSIANAVMILERQLTTCLMLYARLVMNERIVCLPESYLSMVKFWDFVDRPQPSRKTITFYTAIQNAPQFFPPGPEGQRNFNRLQELTWDVVNLTFGKIISKYNIVNDALCATKVDCVDAERVLVLVLTMLCNCGQGIPQECEKLIREHLLTLQLHQELSQKLKKCIEDARNAIGFQDVVLCLREILSQKPRQERLVDVKWDEVRSKDSRINCRIDMYSKQFRYEIDASTVTRDADSRPSEEPETTEDETDYNYSQEFNEEETHSQRQEPSEERKEDACLVLQRAYFKWKDRKEAKEKFEAEIKNDVVESHFQSFKLDKSGCTICGRIQFVDLKPKVADPSSSEPSSTPDQDEEGTWKIHILQRNTFKTHCCGRSPHWKKEKSFARFKDFYRKRVWPTTKKATQLIDEMTKSQEETEVNYSLDLDRLNDALSRLQTTIKKVEDEYSWDSVRLIESAVETVNKLTLEIKSTTSRKGGVQPNKRGVNEDSGEEYDHLDEDAVGPLKPVNTVRRKRGGNRKGKRK